MAGARVQTGFLVHITFPPQSSEWDSQGTHLTSQLRVRGFAALNSLIPRAGGAQQTWEGRPGPTSRAHTWSRNRALPTWGAHYCPLPAPAPGIQVCPLWGAATVHIVHLSSPREDWRAEGVQAHCLTSWENHSFSFAEKQVRKKKSEKKTMLSCQSSLLETCIPRNR